MSAVDVLLAEYQSLKAEQAERVKLRDNFTYATLTALAAIVAGVLQTGAYGLLLVVPFVCAVLGWTRLVNDAKVTAIGLYIGEVLAARLRQHTGSPAMWWEVVRRTAPDRRWRKTYQLAADLLTFTAPGLVAVVVWVTATPRLALLGILAALAGLAICTVLTVQIIRHADITNAPAQWCPAKPEPPHTTTGGAA